MAEKNNIDKLSLKIIEELNDVYEGELPSEEQAYIKALFEENKTEAALADALGVSQQAVNRKIFGEMILMP